MAFPTVALGCLPADGSVRYTSHGFELVGTVNGPIEPQRRDELPEEAFIEVNVKPAAGTGGPRERHLEKLVHSVLRSVVLVEMHPRTLIQVTLQMLVTPETDAFQPWASHLAPLPHLLMTALFCLLDANIPMSQFYTAAMIGVVDGDIVAYPQTTSASGGSTSTLAARPLSLHVFAFSSRGQALLVESEGETDAQEIGRIYDTAEQICRRLQGEQVEDSQAQAGMPGSLQSWIRETMEQSVREATKWRGSITA